MLGKVLSMVLSGGGSNNKLIQYADGTLTEVTAEDLKGASNISPYAFVLCNKLINVTIPDSVTTIGYYAFMQCPELSSITIGSGVTSIGDYAFAGCSKLTTVYYTGDVASWCKISGSGFETLMSNVTTLYINGQKVEGDLVIPDSVTSIGNNIFRNCSGLTSVTIPDSVTSIGESAFYGCSGLTSITIGNGVTNIDYNAFYGCSKLTTVYYTGDVEGWCKISGSGFETLMSNVTTLYINGQKVEGDLVIPDSVTSIGTNTFRNCTGLTSVTIPDSVTSIDSSAFYNCSGLTSVTIPDSVMSIGSSAFYNCSGLTSVTGSVNNTSTVVRQANPNSFAVIITNGTSIDNYAFQNCAGLTSVTIPNSVTSIGDYAFENCTSLTSVTIPDNVTSIGNSAFKNCSGLTSMTLPFIGARKTASDRYNQVFGYIFGYTISSSSSPISGATYQYYDYDRSKYYHYYIPSSIKSVIITGGNIPSNAFYNCESLTSITIPDSATSISDYAFYNCRGLTSMTIPDSVTSIIESAFRNCSGLRSVTIGSGVTSIRDDAFNGCSKLRDIYIADISAWCNISGLNNLMESRARNLYLNNELITSLTIPDGVTSIGSYAFYNYTGLTSVTFPNSVTSIDYKAFSGCSGLTSITIPNSVTSIGSSAFSGCYKLVEVYNKSTLSITAGSSDNGYVARYAKNVYTNEGGSKLTTDENGYVIYTDGAEKILIAHTGTETELTLPADITQINKYAFRSCINLTSITIPNSVTSIGESAFNECYRLVEVYNKSTLSITVGDIRNGEVARYAKNVYTNEGGSKLSTDENGYIIYTDGAEKILVAYTGAETELVLPADITQINQSAFYNCESLASVTIPESVTSIGYQAFFYCNGLTSIIIPDRVTRIYNYVFSNCSGLTSVTIGIGVTSIDSQSFYNCSDLTSITLLPTTPPVLDSSAFSLISSSAVFTVPKGTVDAYKAARGWSEYSSKIVEAAN